MNANPEISQFKQIAMEAKQAASDAKQSAMEAEIADLKRQLAEATRKQQPDPPIPIPASRIKTGRSLEVITHPAPQSNHLTPKPASRNKPVENITNAVPKHKQESERASLSSCTGEYVKPEPTAVKDEDLPYIKQEPI